ncbi:hypothetical protein OIU77_007494 [Salix suchowensis]|uniref:FIST domain-containing protein n=1 Tax=Salix suchowensis TaxID=1278906 RepID=A0ABQ9AGC0_9ROSI|nr:hypothetical protein OIU77_007494 [Salix suchowensis]
MDILHYTSTVSDCQAPAAIIIFGDKTTDMKPAVSKMDCVMPEETVMVGDASTSFIFRNGDSSLIHLAHTCYFQPVALVFARDRYEPEGIGEIQFHITMSKGVMPFGPKLEAASVLLKDSECSWISAKLEGQNGIVAAGEILNDLKQQFRDADMSADIYIGVTKETIRTNDSGILIPGRCLDFYEVRGGGGRYFNVHGVDIRPGDSFLSYHSDSETASSTCDHALQKLLTLKAELKSKNHLHLSKFTDKDEKKEVLGGLIFSRDRRGESFFGEPFVDSSPFFDSLSHGSSSRITLQRRNWKGPQNLDE